MTFRITDAAAIEAVRIAYSAVSRGEAHRLVYEAITNDGSARSGADQALAVWASPVQADREVRPFR